MKNNINFENNFKLQHTNVYKNLELSTSGILKTDFVSVITQRKEETQPAINSDKISAEQSFLNTNNFFF